MGETCASLFQYYSENVPALCRGLLAAAGAGCLLRVLLYEFRTLSNGFRAYFLAPHGVGHINLKQYGSWAVVTGASDGIGRGYALELARQGLNVVLISRSEQKLQAVANEIRTEYGVETIIVAVDFMDGQAVFPVVADALEDLDVGILVNNVGLSYEHPEYFLEVTKERHRQIIEINCQTTVQMTYMVLPKMVEKNRGIIVNLSSMSDVAPNALLVTYGATKKFVRHFTSSLRYEFASKGIIFQTVACGMVATAMSNARKVTFFTADPVSYSRAAVATIGIQDYTHGYWSHALLLYLLKRFPRTWYSHYSGLYLQHARKVCLRRKSEGTLISQLRQQKSD